MNDESILSEPWQIYFPQDDNEKPHDSMNHVTRQIASLAFNEQNVSAEPKNPCSWSQHEKLTGEILNQAAKRAAAETHRNICVYHPTQNHRPSQNGPNIRPDYIIAWSYNGVRKNTAVIDAKDHHGQIPTKEYDKICRDMRETKATRGILILGEDATISDSLRDHIKRDNKVDIVQMNKDQGNVVRDVTQYIGKIIDPSFVPDNKKWGKYECCVTSTDVPKERRPNPHGENAQYTCSSTYHKFSHPRKEDGTLDERYEANQDRNKDGGPDMRIVHNKTQQAQEQHLKGDGSEDMRAKEHRDALVDKSGHRLNVDGTPDERCKENAATTSSKAPLDDNSKQINENADMRQKENRENLVDNQGHHLNLGGSRDMRCTENKTDDSSNISSHDDVGQLSEHADMRLQENRQNIVDQEGHHLNTDGSPDMRCKENQEALNVPSSSEDQLSANQTGQDETSGADTTDIPTKNDGTPDMRYSASQDAVGSGEISRDEVLSGGSEPSFGGAGESSLGMAGGMESVGGGDGGGGDGPLKADGTPDMRFSANQ